MIGIVKYTNREKNENDKECVEFVFYQFSKNTHSLVKYFHIIILLFND